MAPQGLCSCWTPVFPGGRLCVLAGTPQAHQPVTSCLSANAAPREGGSPLQVIPPTQELPLGSALINFLIVALSEAKKKSSLRAACGQARVQSVWLHSGLVSGVPEDTAASPPGRSWSWCAGSPVSPPSLLCFPLSPPPGSREPASPPRHLEVPRLFATRHPWAPRAISLPRPVVPGLAPPRRALTLRRVQSPFLLLEVHPRCPCHGHPSHF